jgi:hypothetical protein
VERLLLLWDELDEVAQFGRLIAASVGHTVSRLIRG